MCQGCIESDLEELFEACLHIVHYTPDWGWYVVEDEHGDNARKYLIPVMKRLKERYLFGS